jgi:hypothetical protein
LNAIVTINFVLYLDSGLLMVRGVIFSNGRRV